MTQSSALTNRATATSSTPEATSANTTAVTINSAQRIPTLKIARAGSNVVLSRLINSTDLFLQAKTSLATTSVWNVVTNPSVVVGNENRVTNATPANRFYRLAK